MVNSGYDGTLCQGRIEAAHCFTKKAHPSVRYELWAGEPLCAYHHLRFGNGEEWRDFLRFFHWGSALYWERYALACQTRKLDLRAVRASLESGEATE